MVGSCHKQLLNIIIIDGLHTFDTTTATMLCTEIISAHTFDIAKFCHCNDSICHWNQVFHGNIVLIVSDGCTSVIAIFSTDHHDFFFDNTKQFFLICQDCFQLSDTCHQLFVLSFQLLAFQTGQRSQSHIYDCLRLCIGQTKTLH